MHAESRVIRQASPIAVELAAAEGVRVQGPDAPCQIKSVHLNRAGPKAPGHQARYCLDPTLVSGAAPVTNIALTPLNVDRLGLSFQGATDGGKAATTTVRAGRARQANVRSGAYAKHPQVQPSRCGVRRARRGRASPHHRAGSAGAPLGYRLSVRRHFLLPLGLVVFPVRLPTLRERREGLDDLVPIFIDELNARSGQRVETVPA